MQKDLVSNSTILKGGNHMLVSISIWKKCTRDMVIRNIQEKSKRKKKFQTII